jgi:menaquinone-dependent protoporphyrinogen IX oxidase
VLTTNHSAPALCELGHLVLCALLYRPGSLKGALLLTGALAYFLYASRRGSTAEAARAIAQEMIGAQGDLRDWDAIRNWARQVPRDVAVD